MTIHEHVFAVVVLYKMKFSDSPAILTLEQSISAISSDNENRMDILVYDNYPKTNEDKLFHSKFLQLHYLADYENSGVSKAYNEAAKIAEKTGKRYLLLLDQDTELTVDFCSELNALLDKRYNLIMPKLITPAGDVISPCRFIWGRGRKLSDNNLGVGIHNMTKRNFLNSGSVINIDLFEQTGGFDENIPLYFSDFNFFERVKKYENQYFQMASSLTHNMASNDESDLDKFSFRFQCYCYGALMCYHSFTGRLIMTANILARSLKVGVHHRTLHFTKIAIQNIYAIYFK